MIYPDQAENLRKLMHRYLEATETIEQHMRFFDMETWHARTDCGTTHCVAGFMQIRELARGKNASEIEHLLEMKFPPDPSIQIVQETRDTFRPSRLHAGIRRSHATIQIIFHVGIMLYGGAQESTLENLYRMRKRATWLLFRAERILEEQENAQRPRRDRQDHSALEAPVYA